MGDKVRIKNESFFEEFPVLPNHTIQCNGLDITPEMRTYWGEEATVMEIETAGENIVYGLSIDKGKHRWNAKMLELKYDPAETIANALNLSSINSREWKPLYREGYFIINRTGMATVLHIAISVCGTTAYISIKEAGTGGGASIHGPFDLEEESPAQIILDKISAFCNLTDTDSCPTPFVIPTSVRFFLMTHSIMNRT